jgi:hypothetical protein
MVCEFVKITKVALVYEFGRVFFYSLFLIEHDFFIVCFPHIVKKIIWEKNHVIKHYKVTKIKECEETIVHLHQVRYGLQ